MGQQIKSLRKLSINVLNKRNSKKKSKNDVSDIKSYTIDNKKIFVLKSSKIGLLVSIYKKTTLIKLIKMSKFDFLILLIINVKKGIFEL